MLLSNTSNNYVSKQLIFCHQHCSPLACSLIVISMLIVSAFIVISMLIIISIDFPQYVDCHQHWLSSAYWLSLVLIVVSILIVISTDCHQHVDCDHYWLPSACWLWSACYYQMYDNNYFCSKISPQFEKWQCIWKWN